MMTTVSAFQDSGIVHLTHSSMKHHNSANFVIKAAQMVVYELVQITASVMISNVLAVLIPQQSQIVSHVDS
jgi:uncharacterized membrane protein